jgi:hypothetical protein
MFVFQAVGKPLKESSFKKNASFFLISREFPSGAALLP